MLLSSLLMGVLISVCVCARTCNENCTEVWKCRHCVLVTLYFMGETDFFDVLARVSAISNCFPPMAFAPDWPACERALHDAFIPIHFSVLCWNIYVWWSWKHGLCFFSSNPTRDFVGARTVTPETFSQACATIVHCESCWNAVPTRCSEKLIDCKQGVGRAMGWLLLKCNYGWPQFVEFFNICCIMICSSCFRYE